VKRMFAALESARAAGALRDVDLYLARHLLALEPAPLPAVALAIAALSRANADGDVCLDLACVAGTRLFAAEEQAYAGIAAPSLPDWLTALHGSVLVMNAETVDGSHASAPLVLDLRNRLYLQKYFSFERAILNDINARIARPVAMDAQALQQALACCFAGRAPGDAQVAAAATAAQRLFTVITGGPGTGKTTTVTRLLAVLLMLGADTPPRIALAAPTGKAAARLGESIRGAVQALHGSSISAELLARIPLEAATLHRLLGWQPGGGFRHNAGNPLPVDVLVVDEASMIDLPLMSRLLAAVPATARLVLLGDYDQLASVEAGSVLGDLCNRGDTSNRTRAVAACIAVLTHSHRFDSGSGIGALARATNAGDINAAITTLQGHDDIAQQDISAATLATAVATDVRQYLAAYRRAGSDAAAITAFNRFRFLCVMRNGPFGIDSVNRLAERELENAGLIDTRAQHGAQTHAQHSSQQQRHYAGRPLLITENDYGMQLFNGDTGLVLPDEAGVLRACFLLGDGSVRRVALNRLPAHETCYAMTVHKAQGSEFDAVSLVLPDEDSPLLTRELVYTAITRARRHVSIHGSRALLARAIARQINRSSGLRDALWLP
jgi:exodeoxyribonuclease V alpha subunit